MSDVLDDLAIKISEELKREGVTLQQMLDAFKILSAREAAMTKSRPKAPARETDDDDDDDAPPTFESMRNVIKSVGR